MISIRKATSHDLPVLMDFQCKLALESENVVLDTTVLRQGMQALLNDPSKGFYYVAEDQGEIVGCHMITYEWSDWRNGVVWWMQSVYVKESHRKQGVFRKMYTNLMELIKQDKNVRGLRLYVDRSNTKAERTYEALGMNGEHYTVFERMAE